MKKVALIPARSGSKRIRNKNIRLLDGHPLIAYTIQTAIKSQMFDSIVFATDSKEYGEIAKYYGAEVPFLRQKSISGDKSPDIEWVNFMLEGLNKIGKNFDLISILRPTSPLRLDSTIKAAFNKFLSDKNYDSLRAVEKCSQHPGKMWVNNNNNNMLFPLFPFKVDGIPWHSSQYSSLPEIYIQNASLEICWTKTILDMGSISGTRIMPFITSNYEGFDINNEEDFILAEALLRTNKASTIKIETKPYQEAL